MFRSEKCCKINYFVPKNVDTLFMACYFPIEVKAEENLKSKSLKQFYINCPESKPVRISMSDYRKQDWMVNIPLFIVFSIKEII